MYIAIALGWICTVVILLGIAQVKNQSRDVKGAEVVTSEETVDTSQVSKQAKPPASTPNELEPTPTPQMQYGGWYHNPDTGRTQRYMGKDANGNETWTDNPN